MICKLTDSSLLRSPFLLIHIGRFSPNPLANEYSDALNHRIDTTSLSVLSRWSSVVLTVSHPDVRIGLRPCFACQRFELLVPPVRC